MKPKSVDRFLKAFPSDVRAVLFFGPDEGQVRERARTLGRTLVGDLDNPFTVVTLTSAQVASDPALLYDEMAAQSLMGGRRLVRVRDGADAVTPAMQKFLQDPPSGTTVLIVEAGELGAASKLRKLFEAADTPHAAALACYEADAKDLVALAGEMLRDAGVTVSRDALDLLADLIARDRAVARGEIDKLILYAGASRTLSYDDVAAAVGDSALMDLDAPAWAAAGGQLEELDRALDRLFADGQSAVGILRAAQRHFTRLYEVVGTPAAPESAMKALRPPVFWKDEARFRQQITLWDPPRLEAVLTRLTQAEAECKRTGLRDTTICSRTLMSITASATRMSGRT